MLFGSLGAEEHGHMAAVQLGVLLHSGHFAALLTELLQQNFANGGMGHFTATEADSHLDTVAFLQELLCILQLDVEVVGVDIGRHTDFLDLHHFLVLLVFLFLLHLLEAELAVIHDLADRGSRVGRDLHQIQILFIGQLQSIFSGHNTKLFAVIANDTNFLIPDLLIELMF